MMRLRPGCRLFLNDRNLMHRGEVIVFRPNIRNDFFSTDPAGYRHIVLRGETLGVRDILQRERYGIVLGSSNIFGIGTAGNENSLASLLGEHFGFPFAGITLPEGNSRNLFSQLSSLLGRVPRPPQALLHFTGGDYTAFCYSSIADAVYGSPNIKQYDQVVKERGGPPSAEDHFKPLLAFTTLWTQSIVRLCRWAKIPVLLGNDTTFFEKREPSPLEAQCGVGVAFTDTQKRWFSNHKRFIREFMTHREALAQKLGVAIPGPGLSNDFGFFDEFHYDEDGTRKLFESIAPTLETMVAVPKASAA